MYVDIVNLPFCTAVGAKKVDVRHTNVQTYAVLVTEGLIHVINAVVDVTIVKHTNITSR